MEDKEENKNEDNKILIISEISKIDGDAIDSEETVKTVLKFNIMR